MSTSVVSMVRPTAPRSCVLSTCWTLRSPLRLVFLLSNWGKLATKWTRQLIQITGTKERDRNGAYTDPRTLQLERRLMFYYILRRDLYQNRIEMTSVWSDVLQLRSFLIPSMSWRPFRLSLPEVTAAERLDPTRANNYIAHLQYASALKKKWTFSKAIDWCHAIVNVLMKDRKSVV